MADILLVDDEAAVRWVLADALTRQGHACREASDGQEALRMLRDAPADLIVSDICMPRMDGLTLLRQVLGAGRRWVPFLFLSAQGDADAEQTAREAGALGTLQKPCPEKDLARAIEAALSALPPAAPAEPTVRGAEAPGIPEAPGGLEGAAGPTGPAEEHAAAAETVSPDAAAAIAVAEAPAAESQAPAPRRRTWIEAIRNVLPKGRQRP